MKKKHWGVKWDESIKELVFIFGSLAALIFRPRGEDDIYYEKNHLSRSDTKLAVMEILRLWAGQRLAEMLSKRLDGKVKRTLTDELILKLYNDNDYFSGSTTSMEIRRIRFLIDQIETITKEKLESARMNYIQEQQQLGQRINKEAMEVSAIFGTQMKIL